MLEAISLEVVLGAVIAILGSAVTIVSVKQLKMSKKKYLKKLLTLLMRLQSHGL